MEVHAASMEKEGGGGGGGGGDTLHVLQRSVTIECIWYLYVSTNSFQTDI